MYSTGTQNINLGDMNLLLLLNASNVGFLGLSSHLGIESGSCEPNTGQSSVKPDWEVCANTHH
jgi:hypothetical protein